MMAALSRGKYNLRASLVFLLDVFFLQAHWEGAFSNKDRSNPPVFAFLKLLKIVCEYCVCSDKAVRLLQ